MDSRRNFIKKAAVTVGAFTIVPSSVLFAKAEVRNKYGEIIRPRIIAPSDKVNMAFCGIGNQGGSDVQSINRSGMVNTTVLCDVDMGAQHTVRSMNDLSGCKKIQGF